MTLLQQPAPGTVIGGEFRVVKPLGVGGMGSVYVAEQASTGKLRAIKMMHPGLVADSKLRERFEQEARVSSRIPSAHVVQTIGAGVDQATGAPWIAMELLEGEDLSTLLRRRGALSPAEVHDIFRQLCHGLGAAHRAGVVHRDIKPENIYLANSQSASEPLAVRILDFGIAKVAAEAMTMSTAAIGTPLWMAPEQTDSRARISTAADVWPLGLIAFAMLTGRMYWRGANEPALSVPALMRELLFDPLVPASVRAAELGCADRIPPGFDAWFARCVHREPEQRFPTAMETIEALGPALFSARAGIAITPPSASGFSAGAFASFSGPTAATPANTGPTLQSPGGPAAGPPNWAYAPTGAISPQAQAAQHYAAPPMPMGMPYVGSTTGAGAIAVPAAPPRRGKGPLLAAIGALAGAAVVIAVVLLVIRDEKPSRHGARGREREQEQQPDTALTADAPRATGPTKTGFSPAQPTLQPTQPGPAPQPGIPTQPGPSPDPLQPGTPKPTPTIVVKRPFDHAAANASIQQMNSRARVSCSGKSGPKFVSGTLFFNPSSGTVQRFFASNPADLSTDSGSCMFMMLQGARVPPFDPPEVSVSASASIN